MKLERSEFSSNFEFDRNMLSGTGARASFVIYSFVIAEGMDDKLHSLAMSPCHMIIHPYPHFNGGSIELLMKLDMGEWQYPIVCEDVITHP